MEGADHASPQHRQLVRLITKVVNEAVCRELEMVAEMVSISVQRAVKSYESRLVEMEAQLREALGSRNDGAPTPVHQRWGTERAVDGSSAEKGQTTFDEELVRLKGDFGSLAKRAHGQMEAMDAEISSLGVQLQEDLELIREDVQEAKLSSGLQAIATGVLALTSPDLSAEEKEQSVISLCQEGMDLREQLRASKRV